MGYDFRDPSRVEGPGDIARWITSYYIHPDIDDRAATYVDPTKPPSIEGITHEEMAAMNEDEAKMRSDFPLYIAMGQLLIEQADKVLYDETLVKRWFPKVEIVYLDCKQTIWDLAYCRTKVEKRYREIEGQRRSIRSMRFIDVEGANHCVSRYSHLHHILSLMRFPRRCIWIYPKLFGQLACKPFRTDRL